jgi:hypothetical protein
MRVDLMGPTVEFLTSPQEASINFCVLKGVIPPGVAVPLHSHIDTEDFIVISGEVQALRQGTQCYEWTAAKAEDYLHVPVAHGTAGATLPASLSSHSSSRPHDWPNSFRRWEDKWRPHPNE